MSRNYERHMEFLNRQKTCSDCGGVRNEGVVGFETLCLKCYKRQKMVRITHQMNDWLWNEHQEYYIDPETEEKPWDMSGGKCCDEYGMNGVLEHHPACPFYKGGE